MSSRFSASRGTEQRGALFRSLASPELPRFILVETVCAGFYFGFLRGFLNFSAFSANLTAYFLCFGFGYHGQRRIAFRSTVSHRPSLPRYALLQACVGLGVAFAVEWLTRNSGLRPYQMSLLAAAMAGMASFIVSAT